LTLGEVDSSCRDRHIERLEERRIVREGCEGVRVIEPRSGRSRGRRREEVSSSQSREDLAVRVLVVEIKDCLRTKPSQADGLKRGKNSRRTRSQSSREDRGILRAEEIVASKDLSARTRLESLDTERRNLHDCEMGPEILRADLRDIDPVEHDLASGGLDEAEERRSDGRLVLKSKASVARSVLFDEKERVEVQLTFPLPVGPTTPTCSPALMEKETSWRTSGRFGSYRTLRPSTETSPDVGQAAGGRNEVICGGAPREEENSLILEERRE